MAINLATAGQLANQAVGAYVQYSAARSQARIQRANQSFRNAVNDVHTSRAPDAQYVNQERALAALAAQNRQIQQTAAAQRAEAEVAAAAAGVTGGSVQGTQRDLTASASRALFANRQETVNRARDFETELSNTRLRGILGEDTQVIQGPSAAAALLGTAAQLGQTYLNNDPRYQRMIGKLR